VTACSGGRAEFSCVFQFASGTPNSATWLRNGNTDVSSEPFHLITDDSNVASPTPVNVTTRLLISNLTLAAIESGVNYLCDEGGVRSDPATLTILSGMVFCVGICVCVCAVILLANVANGIRPFCKLVEVSVFGEVFPIFDVVVEGLVIAYV